jgi:hypothetical protein
MELTHFRRSVGEVTFFSLSARSRFRAIAFGFSDLSVAVIPAQAGIQGRATVFGHHCRSGACYLKAPENWRFVADRFSLRMTQVQSRVTFRREVTMNAAQSFELILNASARSMAKMKI